MLRSGSFVKAASAVLVCAVGFAGGTQQRRPHSAVKAKPAPPAASRPAALPETFSEAIRENNIGMALMERHQFPDALARFQRACVMNPQSDIGCLNMGIALLNMRSYDNAAKILHTSLERDPRSARAWYNLALLDREAAQLDAARSDFEKVAELDPDDADTQYFLGYLAAQAQRYDRAAEAFQRATELNPFHASAEYGLAQAEEHRGNSEAAKGHMARFQTITSHKLGKPIRFLYGEQGKYSLAQEMIAPPQAAPPPIPVHFVDVTSLAKLPWKVATSPSARPVAGPTRTSGKSAATGLKTGDAARPLAQFLGSGACVFDYDGDGKPDILLVDGDGKGHAGLYRNTGKGTFVDVTKAAKLNFGGEGTGCAVGDYDNDGHPDLAIGSSSGVVLFHNQGDGTFSNVTEASGVRTNGLVLGVTFVDYDGDGDLDLYATRFSDFPLEHPNQPFQFPYDAPAAGNTLWRNRGNGTFSDITAQMGLGGDAPSISAITADVEPDCAVDLLLTGWRKFPALLVNSRDGAFRAASPWAISMSGPTAGAAAFDFNHDGSLDFAFTHWAPPGLSIWRNVAGKSFQRVPLAGPGWMRGWGLATLDYDNDGWTDLVAVGETFSGEGRIALFRNEGAAGFRDVTKETGLDKILLHDPRSVIAFDFDGDGATDLLITQTGRPPVLLKNVGGNKNPSLQLALAGDPDNHLGIEARVEIFAGAGRQTFQVPGASGYLSQGPSEMSIGLGGENSADVVRVIWPSGAVQDEIEVRAGKRTEITEGTNP